MSSEAVSFSLSPHTPYTHITKQYLVLGKCLLIDSKQLRGPINSSLSINTKIMILNFVISLYKVTSGNLTSNMSISSFLSLLLSIGNDNTQHSWSQEQKSLVQRYLSSIDGKNLLKLVYTKKKILPLRHKKQQKRTIPFIYLFPSLTLSNGRITNTSLDLLNEKKLNTIK